MVVGLLATLLIQSSVEVDRSGYVTHAATIGTGRPIIAIAGGPGFSGQSLWGIGYGMKESCKTYLFDQLGTGRSRLKDPAANLKDHVSLSNTVDDLEALRKKSGHKKWVVLGQSWGVIVAINYAAKYPSAVEHLILTSVPGLDRDGYTLHANLDRVTPQSVQMELLDMSFRQDLSQEQKTETAVLTGIPYYFFDPKQGKELASHAPQGIFNAAVFHALENNILTTERYSDNLSKLKGTRFPVTMIQGHQDPCGSAMPFLLKEKHFPKAKIVMLDRCGHFPWLESSTSFFSALHDALKLPAPKYLSELTQWDQPLLNQWFEDRRAAGWPFGFVKKPD